jgi:hypothetical protein
MYGSEGTQKGQRWNDKYEVAHDAGCSSGLPIKKIVKGGAQAIKKTSKHVEQPPAVDLKARRICDVDEILIRTKRLNV